MHGRRANDPDDGAHGVTDLLLITGASRGIGRSTAELFAEMNYEVLNISRSPASHGSIVNHQIDLSDPNWARDRGRAIREAATGYDRIALIHNAGTLNKDSVRDLKSVDLLRVLQVNLVAALQLNQLVLPLMKDGSSILYVGSTLSEMGVAGACSYVVAKHALLGLMRATCQDLAGTGIHTACICPGFTDTEMLREHMGGSGETLAAIASGIAFGRLIEPDEIARTLLFCAENPVINGAVLHVNLGQLHR